MPAGPQCATAHYKMPVKCTLVADHPAEWHQALHPQTCARLRWRTSGGVRHTQEWESDDDAETPEAGEWITWHYVVEPEPTPVIVDDLDQRMAALVSGHFPTGRSRTSPDDGPQDQCACGQWYRAARPDLHLGRQLSLLARSFFDLALRYAPPPAQPTE